MFYQNPKKTGKSHGPAFAILAVAMSMAASALVSSAAVVGEPTPDTVSVDLAWDPVPETNVVGYRVCIGTASGQYSRIEVTDTDASFTVSGLDRGETYYFAVLAYNDQGVEGKLSDELVVTIATPPLPAGISIQPDASGSVRVLSWSFPQSALTSSPEIIIERSTDLTTWSEADVVWSGDYTGQNGEMVTFEWPIPTGGGTAEFFRLTARNWLGTSTQP